MNQFKIPELGENISSAVIVGVLVKIGDEISVDQSVLELETDKATIEVPSDVSGTVVSISVNEGDKVTIGQVVFEVKEGAVVPTPGEIVSDDQSAVDVVEIPAAATGPLHAVVLVENQPPILQNAAPAAPSVRRLAREIGVNVNDVNGSGPGGRISLDDVKAYSKSLDRKSTRLNSSH